MQIHTPTVVFWVVVVFPPPPPLEFLICCSISKRFYPQWKAFDLFYKIRDVYFIGGGAAGEPVTSPTMVAVLAVILDFTKN